MCCVDGPVDYGDRVKGQARRHGTVWSHLMCTTRAELDAMAKRLGIKQSYRQHSGLPTEHYDLVPAKRERAIRFGAVACTGREQVERVVNLKIDAGRGDGTP